MRAKTRFVISINEEIIRQHVYSLSKIKAPSKPKGLEHIVVIELFHDTPEYLCVVDFLENHPEYTCVKSKDLFFTEEELLQAPLMRMAANSCRGGYPQPEGGRRDTNYLSVSYDISSGCPYCTKGMLQNRPLKLKKTVSLGKKIDISGVEWLKEFIINRRLKELLETSDLTGFEIWPVVHGKNIPFEDCFQLKIVGQLPPMTPKTIIEYSPTRQTRFDAPCNCGGLYLESRESYYAKDVENIPDFALTHEWFGANDDFWRWPYMSQKAYRLFLENHISGIRYYPPEIIP